MATIFISYSRQSEAIAKTLAEDIEALGHTVWFDQELSGGQAWWDQILATVRSCDVFVFVLEPAALNSTACKREYGYAVDLGKPILPVLVSEGVSTNLLPPALSQIQFVDYRKQDRNAGFRLARALTTVPSPAPLPNPLPAPPEAPISYLGSLTTRVETTSTLSYEEQSALVFDLKRSLRDPGPPDDTRTLLERLRKRRDLFATMAEEIDELLGSMRKASAAPLGSAKMTPSSPERSQKEEMPRTPAESTPLERQKPQHSATVPGPPSAATIRSLCLTIVGWAIGFALGRTVGGSIGWAIVGGIGGSATGLALRWITRSIQWGQVWMVCIGWTFGWWVFGMMWYEWGIIPPIGGAVAGAIGGFVTGLVLRGMQPPIQWMQVGIVGIGWAFGWGIGLFDREIIAPDLPGLVINAVIVSVIGNGLMFLWLSRRCQGA
jgi:hypothetical protein